MRDVERRNRKTQRSRNDEVDILYKFENPPDEYDDEWSQKTLCFIEAIKNVLMIQTLKRSEVDAIHRLQLSVQYAIIELSSPIAMELAESWKIK